eukprot:3429550-Pyramimonas_sp.AAC.1
MAHVPLVFAASLFRFSVSWPALQGARFGQRRLAGQVDGSPPAPIPARGGASWPTRPGRAM